MKWIKSWGEALNEGAREEKELVEAIKSGDTPRVRELLDAGVDPNARDEYGRNSLLVAVDFKREEIAEMLIERGADIDIESWKGATPLHSALGSRMDRTVSMLIEAGADLEKREGEYGRTALQAAAAGAYLEGVKMLIYAGADPNATLGRGASYPNLITMLRHHIDLDRARIARSDVYRLDKRGAEFLERKIEIMKLLIIAGVALPASLNRFDDIKEFFNGDLSWYPGGERALERKFRSIEIRKNLF